ncbi:MAG: hypothetical protein IH944_13900 [Armatimonadetes bacterium]|nr:hypothetical protein [Armatimonadota bacterium]
MRNGLVVALVALAAFASAQGGFDPCSAGLDEVDDNGNVIRTVWETELVDETSTMPEEWFLIDSVWTRLQDHEHRDKNAVSRLASRLGSFRTLRTAVEGTEQRKDVEQWYSDLAALNMRSFNRGTDVLKYNEANDAYERDSSAYQSSTVTDQNEAMMNAWYTRLNAEYERLVAWNNRIDAFDAALSTDGRALNDWAQTLNSQIRSRLDDLGDRYSPLDRDIGHELLIADKRAEVEAQRKRIQQNNEGLRTLMGVSASVQEIEDWAKLDKERREKGMWEAARSLLDVALAQTSMKYSAQEKITRAELRRFKLDIMYKYKLHPKHVKKILKNWVDDGRSVMTIRTKQDFFKQLGVLVNIAEGLDKVDRGKYLEAAATALGFFNSSPVLGLVVTNAQIYTGLFETALTYYESKNRVAQLMNLSESNLKAVAALTELNKRLVETLNARKQELNDLELRRTY